MCEETSNEEFFTHIFSKLNIERAVTSLALQKYYELLKLLDQKSKKHNNIKVKNNKKRIRLFVCLFSAYNDLGYPVDPRYIFEKMNMDQKFSVIKAFNENPLPIYINPEKYFSFYVDNLNRYLENNQLLLEREKIISESITFCRECMKVRSGRDYIENAMSKAVCIGILYYYLVVHSLVPRCRPYICKAWYVAKTTYINYYKAILNVYNSEEMGDVEYKCWYDNLVEL